MLANTPPVLEEGNLVCLKPSHIPPMWHGLLDHVGQVIRVCTYSVIRQKPSNPRSYEILLGSVPNGFVEVKFQLEEGNCTIHCPAADLNLA